jgi:hypothetical protein
MKGTVSADVESKSARINLVVESFEDAAPAIDAIKAQFRVVWPDIVFSGLDDPPEEIDGEGAEAASAPADAERQAALERRRDWTSPPSAAAPKPARKPLTFSSSPPADSFDGRVLDAAKRLGSTDRGALAEAVDADERVVAMALTRLRRGGALSAAGF